MEQDLTEKKAQTAGLARLQKWCGIRDRTEREARQKMREVMSKMPSPPTSAQAEEWEEHWMTALLEGGHLDDARCAESYTRVHHEHKGWGPLKIKAGLTARGVNGSLADRALNAVSEAQWQASADRLMARRGDELADHQDRVVRWLMQRGFPQRMVWTALDRLSTAGNSPDSDS